MKNRAKFVVGFALMVMFAVGLGTARAAGSPTQFCSGAEYRSLDFWVGEWMAEWDTPGGKATGTNVITRDEYGGCVITERFQYADGSFKGFSVSTYRPDERQWRQVWMDDQGGYFDLVGGPAKDLGSDFVLENKRLGASSPFRRMLFQDVSPGKFIWRWQGRNSETERWTDSWVIRYRRKPGSAAR